MQGSENPEAAEKAPVGARVSPLERRMVGQWRAWGWHAIAEDYDRMKAASFKPAPRRRDPPAPEAFAPWTPPPEQEWMSQWRRFEEQQKVMSAEYERWNGGW